ncbi:acyltransferase [Bacillus sp. JJ1566]|uniref:acyltransferase family protein n=1 Tax=Bacillus sp. JJ1566 TaxID=3122961 RepID=UPI002FFE68B9
MSKRIEQLDSLRGLAAFAVVLHHLPLLALTMPDVVYKLIRYLGINYGHGPVMLFFVLSGFVLSLPFLKNETVNFFPYVIKRYFRIYVPYIIAISFAIVFSQIFFQNKVEVVGSWQHMLWTTPISLKLIYEHLYFLGNIHSNTFNGVIWSLIHELRISLFFPFIVILIKKINWKVTLIICLILSVISGLNNVFDFQVSNGNDITYFHTIHYTALFIFGALLAKHNISVVNSYKKKSFFFKLSFLTLAFFLYNFSEFIVHYLYELTRLEFVSIYFNIIMEYGIAVGSLGIIICALGSVRVRRFLLFKPFQLLGKISFSLYLYHLPAILLSIYLLHDKLSLWMICIISVFFSLGISTVAWSLIEVPSMKMGRTVANKIKEKQLIIITRIRNKSA